MALDGSGRNLGTVWSLGCPSTHRFISLSVCHRNHQTPNTKQTDTPRHSSDQAFPVQTKYVSPIAGGHVNPRYSSTTAMSASSIGPVFVGPAVAGLRRLGKTGARIANHLEQSIAAQFRALFSLASCPDHLVSLVSPSTGSGPTRWECP